MPRQSTPSISISIFGKAHPNDGFWITAGLPEASDHNLRSPVFPGQSRVSTRK